MTDRTIHIGSLPIGPGNPLALIAGPCVIESRDHTLRMADAIAKICRSIDFPYAFKASYDKANRSSIDSFRGPGLEKGLAILAEIKNELNLPVVSDIHLPDQAAPAAKVLDCLQIPAFLCRQTDLLVAAGETGKTVNVKKGQFMSPEQMRQAVRKIDATGNQQVALTDRGTFFGYGRLVNDMTGLAIMREWAPVIFDATHSCQFPGGGGTETTGQSHFSPLLARSAVAAGCDGLFIEVHNDPPNALSDAATVLPLDKLADVLTTCKRVADAVAG